MFQGYAICRLKLVIPARILHEFHWALLDFLIFSSACMHNSGWRLHVPGRMVREEFSGQKKERRLTPPLRRSIGTPLMVDCRSSWAFPTLPGFKLSAAGLRSRDFRSRLSLSTSSGLTVPLARACFTAGFLGSRPFRLIGPSSLRFPVRRSSAAEATSNLSIFLSRSPFWFSDLPEPKPFLVFQSS